MKTVLVSNDDGYKESGLRALVAALGKIEDVEVIVAAPNGQQSGKSQSISFRRAIKVERVEIEGAIESYAIDGTPADCTRWGTQFLRERGIEPDFVFSGINLGNNTGMAIHYSGTVGAAKEGALNGIHSVALSVDNHEATHFEYICGLLEELMEASERIDTGIILSVNAPDLPAEEIHGVKIVESAPTAFGTDYVFKKDEDEGFVLGIGDFNFDRTLDNDWNAVEDGYVAVTPLATEMTHRETLLEMQGLSNSNRMCVLIDFQECLMPAMHKADRLRWNLGKLAACLHALEVPVVLTEQYSKGLGHTIPEIALPLAQSPVVDKTCFSCLASPEFKKAVQGMTAKLVVLAGIESHICLQQTAMDYLAHGYEVVILSDCCASRSKHNHKAAMEMLRDYGCEIATWEAYVYEILGSAKHPHFKEVSAIVKEQYEENY